MGHHPPQEVEPMPFFSATEGVGWDHHEALKSAHSGLQNNTMGVSFAFGASDELDQRMAGLSSSCRGGSGTRRASERMWKMVAGPHPHLDSWRDSVVVFTLATVLRNIKKCVGSRRSISLGDIPRRSSHSSYCMCVLHRSLMHRKYRYPGIPSREHTEVLPPSSLNRRTTRRTILSIVIKTMDSAIEAADLHPHSTLHAPRLTIRLLNNNDAAMVIRPMTKTAPSGVLPPIGCADKARYSVPCDAMQGPS